MVIKSINITNFTDNADVNIDFSISQKQEAFARKLWDARNVDSENVNVVVPDKFYPRIYQEVGRLSLIYNFNSNTKPKENESDNFLYDEEQIIFFRILELFLISPYLKDNSQYDLNDNYLKSYFSIIQQKESKVGKIEIEYYLPEFDMTNYYVYTLFLNLQTIEILTQIEKKVNIDTGKSEQERISGNVIDNSYCRYYSNRYIPLYTAFDKSLRLDIYDLPKINDKISQGINVFNTDVSFEIDELTTITPIIQKFALLMEDEDERLMLWFSKTVQILFSKSNSLLNLKFDRIKIEKEVDEKSQIEDIIFCDENFNKIITLKEILLKDISKSSFIKTIVAMVFTISFVERQHSVLIIPDLSVICNNVLDLHLFLTFVNSSFFPEYLQIITHKGLLTDKLLSSFEPENMEKSQLPFVNMVNNLKNTPYKKQLLS